MKALIRIVVAATVLFVMSGTALSGGLNASASSASEALIWKFQTGEKVYASPVVHAGVVYIGSLDKNFYAINAQTGEKLWQYATGSPVFSTAVVYENTVCVVSGNTFYALDLSGNLNWQTVLDAGAVVNQNDEWDCFLERGTNTMRGSVPSTHWRGRPAK